LIVNGRQAGSHNQADYQQWDRTFPKHLERQDVETNPKPRPEPNDEKNDGGNEDARQIQKPILGFLFQRNLLHVP
jgi:hypothetical protein